MILLKILCETILSIINLTYQFSDIIVSNNLGTLTTILRSIPANCYRKTL